MGILQRIKNRLIGFDSGKYWERRYSAGGNSGAGSYGRLAKFKAEVINELVSKYEIKTVIDWGVGDGNQLDLLVVPHYVGVDVSSTVVKQARRKWAEDASKRFIHTSELPFSEKFELSMSIDVIFHLIEDKVFDQYMKRLVDSSSKYVLVYSSDKTGVRVPGFHVLHRKFSEWININRPELKMIMQVPNRYPFDEADQDNSSFADFYLFQFTS